MIEYVYSIQRKSDGKYLRGARYWMWTRFKFFAFKATTDDQLDAAFDFMKERHPGVLYTVVGHIWRNG